MLTKTLKPAALLLSLLLATLIAITLHTPHLASAAGDATPIPITIWSNSTHVSLNNSYVYALINITNVRMLSYIMYNDDGTSVDALDGGFSNYDNTAGSAIQPSNLLLTIVEQSPTRVHLSFAQSLNDTVRNLAHIDWDFHYVMEAGVRGLYTWMKVYRTERHIADFSGLGELRYLLRLNPGTLANNYTDPPFNTVWVQPDGYVRQPTLYEAKYMADNTIGPKEAALIIVNSTYSWIAQKYDSSVDNRFHQVVGFLNTTTSQGLWIVTPSYEYKNSGPDGQDLTAYGPTVGTGNYFIHSQYLQAGHYGSGDELLPGNQTWSKLYGPWLIYHNKPGTMQASIADAFAQYEVERVKWPYAFVTAVNNSSPLSPGVDEWYKRENRFNVTGRLTVRDWGRCPGETDDYIDATRATLGLTWPKTLVFLTAPESVYGAYNNQSKRYMYWSYVQPNGSFTIDKVVSGTYEVHAWSEGVMGEFVSPTWITVNHTTTTQRSVDIGSLVFNAQRSAPTVFQIGFPDRTAREYFHGNEYRQTALHQRFAQDFPNGINYQIGSNCLQAASQWRHDWNYAHVPSAVPNVTAWRPNEWFAYFDVPVNATYGANAYLRIAVASTSKCSATVKVNNVTIATITAVQREDMSMYRNAIHGLYWTRQLNFNSSILQRSPARNTLSLLNSCTAINQGIEYDALRLEVDDWSPQVVSALSSSTGAIVGPSSSSSTGSSSSDASRALSASSSSVVFLASSVLFAFLVAVIVM